METTSQSAISNIYSFTHILWLHDGIISGVADLVITWKSEWQALSISAFISPKTLISGFNKIHSLSFLKKISSAQASRCSFSNLSDFQPEVKMDMGLARHWCEKCPRKHTCSSHSLRWGMTDGLSEIESELETEIEIQRSLRGLCFWKARDCGRSNVFIIFLALLFRLTHQLNSEIICQPRFTQL